MKNKFSVIALVASLSGTVFAQQPAAPVAADNGNVFQSAPNPLSSGQGTAISSESKTTLSIIQKKRAELELLKLEAELIKAREPIEKARSATVNAQLAQQLAEARSTQTSKGVDNAPKYLSLIVLSVYGFGDQMLAEMKVGDLLLTARVGDKLPSGHYVRSIKFDGVDISMNKSGRGTERLFISGSDAAAIYGSRGKSGSVASSQSAPATMSVTAAPGRLPPLPAR